MHQAFTTPEQRATVLQAIAEGGGVPLGTAMAHARATRLGPWDDSMQLHRDCASLLIGELHTADVCTPSSVYVNAHGQRLSLRDAVLHSPAFSAAYRHARYSVEIACENALRAAIGLDLVVGCPPAGTPCADAALAAAVAEELRL